MTGFVMVEGPDFKAQVFPLEGESLTIGRSPLAQVAMVNADVLELEHFLVAPEEDGCRISTAQVTRHATRFRGQDFVRGKLPWGAVLEIAGWRFRFEKDRRKLGPQAGTRRRLLFAAAVILAVCIAVMAGRKRSQQGVQGAVPELPAELVRGQSCALRGPDATARAHELARQGSSRWERKPYDVADGVAAVELYLEASSCFAAGGDARKSQEYALLADRLGTVLAEDAQLLRVSLLRALEQNNRDALLHAAKRLQPYVAKYPDDLSRWLGSLVRQLQAERQAEKTRQ